MASFPEADVVGCLPDVRDFTFTDAEVARLLRLNPELQKILVGREPTDEPVAAFQNSI